MFAGKAVSAHATTAISALGGFDTDPHGERHDTRLLKANEKDRFLIAWMSILPMMQICSSSPALVVEPVIPAGIEFVIYGRC
ncbi:MAG: hypothetical protein WCH04_05115 [Gammaproteobacteria bacterium]